MPGVNHEKSDSPQNGWIDKALPSFLRPYARLMRLDRPVGTWLLLLPCWWGLALSGGFHPRFMLLFACGALIMRGAGCVINDLFDRKIDRAVLRTETRPLASGEIGVLSALMFLAFLLLCGLGLLLCFPTPVILLGLGVMPLVVLYPLAKRVFVAPQLVLGFVFNWGVLMGSLAVRGRIEWPCVALYAGGVLWTLAYDTIYAHQDKTDDVKIGVNSLALFLGDASRLGVGCFFGASLILIALAGVESGFGGFFYGGLLLALTQALWQIRGWDTEDPKNCLERFKSNRDFGFLILFSLWAGQVL